MQDLTPEEIVARLDRHIVGQEKAKRKVAVALRNRWRRRQLPPDLAAEVYPKNILLIGPTGVGKTEIARRLAELTRAPFLKVEASKYSEVGYHGRDVESMVRDLAEVAVRMVRAERVAEVQAEARERARERILEALWAREDLRPEDDDPGIPGLENEEVRWTQDGGLWRPVPPGTEGGIEPARDLPLLGDEELAARIEERSKARKDWEARLDAGRLEEEILDILVRDRSTPTLSVMGPAGQDAMGIDAAALQELWGRGGGPRMKERRLRIREARRILLEDEAETLVDEDEVVQEAMRRLQEDGILFIDEIDKIVTAGSAQGPDVSREGVQRDLLTIVEGCTVYTKYGYVETKHILFLAAGAFHMNKPSDLLPELQGRFPVRVALQPLREEDFLRILTEPEHSLVKQYIALLETEGLELEFTEDGLAHIAAVAYKANKTTQDIGARRLLTTLEMCLEDLSFQAPDRKGEVVRIDKEFAEARLGDAADDPDLIRYMI